VRAETIFSYGGEKKQGRQKGGRRRGRSDRLTRACTREAEAETPDKDSIAIVRDARSTKATVRLLPPTLTRVRVYSTHAHTHTRAITYVYLAYRWKRSNGASCADIWDSEHTLDALHVEIHATHTHTHTHIHVYPQDTQSLHTVSPLTHSVHATYRARHRHIHTRVDCHASHTSIHAQETHVLGGEKKRKGKKKK